MATTLSYSLPSYNPLGSTGTLSYSIDLQSPNLSLDIRYRYIVYNADTSDYQMDSGYITLFESQEYPAAQTVSGTIQLVPSIMLFDLCVKQIKRLASGGFTPDWSKLYLYVVLNDSDFDQYTSIYIPVTPPRAVWVYDSGSWSKHFVARWSDATGWMGGNPKIHTSGQWRDTGTTWY